MLHKYKKIVPIEAEQFNGSTKQIARYKVQGAYCWTNIMG